MWPLGFGLLLNIDPVYLIADGWLGGHNFADLLANTAIIVGVSSFARGVAKAADGSPPIAKVILGPYVLLVVVAVSTASFSMIETTGSSTLFMVDYGGQPAAAVYSGSQHLYFGLVTLAMTVVCIGQLTNVRGFMLVSTIVLLIGSSGQTLTCVDVIFMDVSHVPGNESLLRLGQSFYDYGNSLSIVLIAAGFGMLPSARLFNSRRTNAQIARLVEELSPAWPRALEARSSGPTVEPSGDQESVLHRQLVEIRDAQASLGGKYDLSPAEISSSKPRKLSCSAVPPLRHDMKADIVARIGAGAALGVTGLAAIAGCVIARALTAPYGGRRFATRVHGVVAKDGRHYVLLDDADQTRRTGLYGAFLPDGAHVRFGAEALSWGSSVARPVERAEAERLAGVAYVSWTGIHFRLHRPRVCAPRRSSFPRNSVRRRLGASMPGTVTSGRCTFTGWAAREREHSAECRQPCRRA